MVGFLRTTSSIRFRRICMGVCMRLNSRFVELFVYWAAAAFVMLVWIASVRISRVCCLFNSTRVRISRVYYTQQSS